jgi:hypothetical protein
MAAGQKVLIRASLYKEGKPLQKPCQIVQKAIDLNL